MPKQNDMDIHDIVVYIRDLRHTEEECERLLLGAQERIAKYSRCRMAEIINIPYWGEEDEKNE
jgi:hypothetical protein